MMPYMCIHLSHVLQAIARVPKSSTSFEHTSHGNFGDGPGLSSNLYPVSCFFYLNLHRWRTAHTLCE